MRSPWKRVPHRLTYSKAGYGRLESSHCDTKIARGGKSATNLLAIRLLAISSLEFCEHDPRNDPCDADGRQLKYPSSTRSDYFCGWPTVQQHYRQKEAPRTNAIAPLRLPTLERERWDRVKGHRAHEPAQWGNPTGSRRLTICGSCCCVIQESWLCRATRMLFQAKSKSYIFYRHATSAHLQNLVRRTSKRERTQPKM